MLAKRKPSKLSYDYWGHHSGLMIRYCEEILYLTEDIDDIKTFVAHRCVYPATLRYIHLLGESTKCIPDFVRERFPDIEWKDMIAMRNVVAHNDEGIDTQQIWDTVQYSVPNLLPKMHRFKKKTEKKYKKYK